MKRAPFFLALLFVTVSLHAFTDRLSVGSVNAPAGTVHVPVYVRDLAETRLGADRPAGERIQALGFRIKFAPASAITGATFTRAGALAKTPLFDTFFPSQNGSPVGFVASFAEASQPLSFAYPLGGPGSLIGYVNVTTTAGLAADTIIQLAIDSETAILSNQQGIVTETVANLGLSLVNGYITISSAACLSFTSATLAVSGPAAACTSGDGGTASVTLGGGAPDPNIQWGWRSTPGGSITPISGATQPSYIIHGPDFGGTGTKYLVATATTSCTEIVTTELAVTISDTPNVVIAASSGVFASSTGNFASVNDPGLGGTYSWSITNGTITSGQGSRLIGYTAGASGQVGLDVVVNASGCAGTSTPHADVPIIARPPGASMFYLVNPCRVLDTRSGSPSASGSTRQVPIGGVCGIPADAESVALNLTVVSPSATGFLSLFPSDVAWPGNSTLNYRTGKTRANNAVVTLSGDGRLSVFNLGSTAHFIVDVTGYFK